MDVSSPTSPSRALSPWRYRVHQDPDRIPDKICIAECLCEGCIMNGKEDNSYNSKPLEVNMLVYKKTKCQGDANRYRMTRALIKVAVGCVCVMPDIKKQ
ncbi:interleukin-17F-like [Halichoeres trimaculatus]|uniref:interleukin-17F-like n=1 Tax=Halichoeres trimaculatus TaxID=147232 RepID=UPI003D9E6B6E